MYLRSWPNQGLGFRKSNKYHLALFLWQLGYCIAYISYYYIVKMKKVGNDPWGDGRTLEWAFLRRLHIITSSKHHLCVDLDAYWIEKMEGKKEMTPAEPIGDIHMPNCSFIPLIMSLVYLLQDLGQCTIYIIRGEKPWELQLLSLGLVNYFWIYVIPFYKR